MKSPLSGGTRRSSASNSSGNPANSSDFCVTTPSATTSHGTASKTFARSLTNALLKCFIPSDPPKSSSNVFSDSSDGIRLIGAASNSGSERKRSIYGASNDSTRPREPGSVIFTIEKIKKMTKNFSPAFKIGQGGFGTVYKGQLEDGTLVAVKRAKNMLHDKHSGAEFRTEVQTLTRIEHLNLVRFYGFLEIADERILVMEYVPNGTLREHLDGIKGNDLDFSARLDIATDVAHAVTYLHMYTDHPIIHRDIKSSNILLTDSLRAKVADFGFARLGADGESGATHVSTQVKGTAGYLDPEYLKTNQLTEKSDVYSFGVLLVELVTGRRPIEPKRELAERVTARWAIKKFTGGDSILIMDPRMVRSPANEFAIDKILELALLCLAPYRQNRPPMRKCAEVLWRVRKDYREFSSRDVLPILSESPKELLNQEYMSK